MKKTIIISILLLSVLCCLPDSAEAQCAMCKAVAEQSNEKGLNIGILYLFLTPYVLVTTIAFLWWRFRRTDEEMEGLTNIKPERMN